MRATPAIAAAFIAATPVLAGDVIIDTFTDPMPTSNVFNIRGQVLAVTQIWAGVSDPRIPPRTFDSEEQFGLSSVVGGARTATLSVSGIDAPTTFDDVQIDSGTLVYTGRNENSSATLRLRYGDTAPVMIMDPLGLDLTDGGSNGRFEIDFGSFSTDAAGDPLTVVITTIGPDLNAPGNLVTAGAARLVSAAGTISIPLSEFVDITGDGGQIDFTDVQTFNIELIGDGVGMLNFEMGPPRFTSGSQAVGTPVAVPYDDSAVRIIWFGNSHSGWNDFPNQTTCGDGVPDLFRFIAVEGGQAEPLISPAIACGQNLDFHWNSQRQRIIGDLAPGQVWSHIVIQGLSTETTIPLGDIPNFQNRAQQLFGLARQTSPAVTNVFYQTHARGFDHPNYSSSFVTPAEYHSQVRQTYRSTSQLIDANFGVGSSLNSPAGDGFAISDWGAEMYRPDLNHMTPLGATTVALSFYATIYGDPALASVPNPFQGGPSDLLTRLTDLGLTENDWLTAVSRALNASRSATCAADFNGDGSIDDTDPADMLGGLVADRPYIDVVQPFAILDVFDVIEWQARFSAPCD